MVAIATVLVVVLVSLLITRVATVAFTLTGLSRDVARFQARSALSGTGFTTSEAEAVVGHPVRRRIAPRLVRAAGIPGTLIGCNPWTAGDDRILEQLEGVPLIRLSCAERPIEAGPDDPGGHAWVWRQALLAAVGFAVLRARRWRARSQPAV